MRTRVILPVLFAVFAFGATGCGGEDPAALVVDTVAPVAVLDVSAEVTTEGIQVAWAASSEADLAGYHVFRSVNGTAFTPVGTVGTNEFTDAGVGNGGSFRYEVAAYDVTGNVGPRSVTGPVFVSVEETPHRRVAVSE
jgi:hypothetical protein